MSNLETTKLNQDLVNAIQNINSLGADCISLIAVNNDNDLTVFNSVKETIRIMQLSNGERHAVEIYLEPEDIKVLKLCIEHFEAKQ